MTRKILLQRVAAYCGAALAVMGLQAQSPDVRQKVQFETTSGRFTVALFDDTPLHRDNFVRLAKAGYYDGLLFHRVIENFVVQTGDPDSREAKVGQQLGEGGPGYDIPAELEGVRHLHYRGAVAAAREPDDVNPERKSSGSQFYVVWGKRCSAAFLHRAQQMVKEATGKLPDYTEEESELYWERGGTPYLDTQYTVFGEIVDGLQVIEEIQYSETDDYDRPLMDVRILKATVVEQAD